MTRSSWLNCALRDDEAVYWVSIGHCMSWMNGKTLWVSVGRYWLAHSGTGSVWSGTGWFLVKLGQYGALLVGTWWYWVSIGRYWLVLCGTGTVWGSAGRYLVVLCQYGVVLGHYEAVYRAAVASTWWYWVGMGRYW